MTQFQIVFKAIKKIFYPPVPKKPKNTFWFPTTNSIREKIDRYSRVREKSSHS